MKIAILGKLANLGWGLESLISRHQDRARVPIGLYDDDDLPYIFSDQSVTHLVSLQGRRIDRKLLRRFDGKKILWNAEFLPYPGFEKDPEALSRLRAIEPLEDFDLILNGCPKSTRWLKETRGINAQWFPMMGVDPLIHRRIPEIEKDIDVGFYGTPNERRARIFSEIAEALLPMGLTVHWANAWGEDLILFINRCKIVLNLHYTDQINTESRIYETLGCGSLCLSEPISMDPQEDHWDIEIGSKDEYGGLIGSLWGLLDEPEYCRAMEDVGYEFIHSHFGIVTVLNMLADYCERLGG